MVRRILHGQGVSYSDSPALEIIRVSQALAAEASGSALGSSLITIPQTFGVEAGAGTLGVIRVAQSLAAETIGNTSGGTYTPASEGGALLHFDMLDPTAYTLNGGSTGVTQIKNKISNVQWLFNGGADCPYEAAGLNGHPCLHPTLITHRSISSEAAVIAALDCPTTAKPHTLVYVVVPDSTTVGGAVLGVGNSAVSSASTRTWGQRTTGGQYEYAQTTPAVAGTGRSAASSVTAGLSIVAWSSPGATLALKKNDVTQALTVAVSVDPSYTGTGPNQVSLFSRPDSAPDTPCTNQFGELWLFNAELDAAALTRVYNYLNARWS